jgi:phosphoketolase
MPDRKRDGAAPGAVSAQDTLVLGTFLRDVTRLNEDNRNFRIFGPDETLSNLLGDVFDVTNRQWNAREVEDDEFLAPEGRVLDSMLSEQLRGLARGLSADGSARPLQLIRGLHPHRRFDVQRRSRSNCRGGARSRR